MPATVDRRFWGIFGASLLVHLGIFAGVNGVRAQSKVELPALQLSWRSPAPAAADAIPTPVLRPPAVTKTAPAKTMPAQVSHSLRSPRQHLSKQPLPSPPAVNAEVAAATVVDVAPALAGPVFVAPTAAVTAPPSAKSALADASLLAAYRLDLGRLLARQQVYPRLAALRGWEGEVRLRLKVARKGTLLAVQLDHSSGFSVLDDHALAMVNDLGPLPPLPATLDENEIQVVVPITYKLNKTT